MMKSLPYRGWHSMGNVFHYVPIIHVNIEHQTLKEFSWFENQRDDFYQV